MPKLLAIDVFAGAGGLSLGFHRAGFHIVAAVELNAKAAQSYSQSFVSRLSEKTACLQADVADGTTVSRLKKLMNGRQLDALIGGPPCQDFSPARLRRQPLGRRASLVFKYLDLVDELRPRAFLFENVPGLLQADSGRHWTRLSRQLGELGYWLHHRELDAQDYGVPQRRRRLIVVGVRKDVDQPFEFPQPIGERTTVGEVFRRHQNVLPEVAPGAHPPSDPNHKARRHRPATLELLALVKPGESWREVRDRGGRVLDCHQGHNGHYDVYGRIDPDQVAPTITGGCTNPSKGRFIHPVHDRGLTVREAALLQTFPPEWTFVGGVESESLQVGNAVPVALAAALGTSLRRTLSSVQPCGCRSTDVDPHVVGANA